MKHSFKDWVAVTRYWSFAVSTMPVVATFAYLCSLRLLPAGPMPLVVFGLSLLGVVLLHSAGNVLSDYFDYKRGVDNEQAYAVPNLVFHKFEPREYLVFSAILFAAGCATGLVICLLSGPGLLAMGIAGVALTVLYSFFKFHALGDLDVFVIFGILPILGVSYAVTGSFHPDALVLSLPIGIITVSVLHANNTVDISSDGGAGIKTFAMLIGARASAILYMVYMAVPFVCTVAAVAAGLLHPFTLFSLVAALPAYRNFRQARRAVGDGPAAMIGLDQASAKLQIVYSGTLSLALFVASFVG